jgi:hypothetical protein
MKFRTKLYRGILSVVMLIFITQLSNAQLNAGVKFGLSVDNPVSESHYIYEKSGFINNSLTLNSSSNSKYIGFFGHANFGYLFLHADVMYNYFEYQYTWTDYTGAENPFSDYIEQYDYLDFSAFSGFNVGPARIGMGPVAHVLLNYESNLENMDFYDTNFRPITFGWRFGIGASYSRIQVDIKYEMNFHTNGYHMMFYDEYQSFDKKSGKFVVTLGISI